MKKQILILILSVLPTFAFAAGGGVQLDSAPIDVSDMESVKRGAQHFIDYCFSCHSAQYMRYNRIARDVGMSDAEVRENLIFTTNEEGEPTKVGSLSHIIPHMGIKKNHRQVPLLFERQNVARHRLLDVHPRLLVVQKNFQSMLHLRPIGSVPEESSIAHLQHHC